MKHVLSLLVEDKAGVLARISGLLSGRGYNVESFSAGHTVDPSLTKITLVCEGDDTIIDQIKKQLNKIVDIIKIVDLTQRSSVSRELALMKVSAKPGKRGEIFQIAEVFKAKVVDVGFDVMVMEVTGSSEKIDDIIELLDGTIIDIARSGLVSMERGKKTQYKPRSK